MVRLHAKHYITCFLLLLSTGIFAQEDENQGNLTGSFQIDAQNYFPDSIIGAPDYPEKVGSNTFLNLTYTRGKFTAGMRFESFLPALQGFTRNKGSGIPYRYIQYTDEKIDVTAGTFYEQFGSGMIFRSYENWGLGFDNVLDGARVKITAVKGVIVKGVIGKMRNAFSVDLNSLSAGLVRGVDGELYLNDILKPLAEKKLQVRIGGSFVSRYQKDEDPIYILPENVATYGGRLQLGYGKISLFAEFAEKINDPSTVNNLIYKKGNGMLVQLNYSTKGFGVSLTGKRIDNMDFRAERSATFNNLTINYLPAITKQHTYRLPTLFPYATQPLGELGYQGEIFYKIKKGSKIGGKYGTQVTLNASLIYGLDKQAVTDPFEGYTTTFMGTTELPFFRDINIELNRTISPKLKGSVMYMNVFYEKDKFKELTGFNTTHEVHANVGVLDVTYKWKPKHIFRTEVQGCFTQQEFGSWAYALLEYNYSTHWFVAVFDEYNYGNAEEEKRLHYFTGQVGYMWDTFRITAGYGRQRAGVLCVGGVCRQVPASNGFQFSIYGTF